MERLKEFYKRSKVTFILLTIMIVYFIFMTLNGGTTNVETLVRYGAFYPPIIIPFNQYHRFITSIFIHIGFMHMFFNGYALFLFGPQIENLMGSKKYLFFFLLAGIGGNLTTFLFNFVSISAGASGSLFGLFGAFLYLIHRHKNMITKEGRKSILTLLGINLALTIFVPSISITAHLGGLVIGYLLSYIFIKNPYNS
ncbi:rhomboid family intramembrane serine protease [Clostridium sp. D2Q-11]|uniref:Rhomboid family intramembrane serine protease n=1 Tax=Anaeromonas frigoriresistens TaxID=2683708 RepID=A0A942Z629_9FIRM|nr:rhomboid family intramembrane serine protease [Anaeromonas frigoriresistens]MBS4538056.1 rhomboid family intramembrane serine protease [Anaeromonas frigoriresistens]